MGVRKNAKFLSAAEREAFVRACVMMKADIVNPAAPAAQQYSKWDEYVAIHQMIQQVTAPGALGVNFGHGGSGSYAFLSWHRYFLVQLEAELQSHVPGVMLPYWDWTDPAVTMTDTFLGPDGGAGDIVRRGYFAIDAPGTGTNPTPAPAWWPAGLVGWRLPAAFGPTWIGGLRRSLSSVGQLPSVNDLRTTMSRTTVPTFQSTLESGSGLASGNQMHNGMHGWIGGHMGNPAASPFDPFFYLHHCNIDRLWAMWQLDGHADEFPLTSPKPYHGRDDLMYPWTGGAPGFATTAAISASIPMPNFTALGAKTNADTLDHRSLGYTYDTMPIIGIALDRTGSMNGVTPDPMVTGAADVTKWEAARRGVSAFLQDCQTVQDSAITYVTAGVKTFRSLGGNQFDNVFAGTGYGLVRQGGAVSRSGFDALAGAMTPGGGTPLADALVDIQAMTEAVAAGAPGDEQRYVAMLTDGMLTSGNPLSSVPDASFGRTVVFAMGFGTGADVDYPTLAALVAKGQSITTPQVFHGENVGTIDKFYSEALARAIGFTSVIDPSVELFAGEHFHFEFDATSAEDVFMITAQGMDFIDDNWSFAVHGPDGHVHYSDLAAHGEHAGHGHCGCPCRVDVTAKRGSGRLSMVIQRDSADDHCWVGRWHLMAAFRTKQLDAMVMPEVADLIAPVAAGPTRGARYANLLIDPAGRTPLRNVVAPVTHRLDAQPIGTNNNGGPACTLNINITAKSRLLVELATKPVVALGEAARFDVSSTVLTGAAVIDRTAARSIAVRDDVARLVARAVKGRLPRGTRVRHEDGLPYDAGLVLARIEAQDPRATRLDDHEVEVVTHDGGAPHIHDTERRRPGPSYLGVFVQGTYCPGHDVDLDPGGHEHHGDHGHVDGASLHDDEQCRPERFTRILVASTATVR